MTSRGPCPCRRPLPVAPRKPLAPLASTNTAWRLFYMRPSRDLGPCPKSLRKPSELLQSSWPTRQHPSHLDNEGYQRDYITGEHARWTSSFATFLRETTLTR